MKKVIIVLFGLILFGCDDNSSSSGTGSINASELENIDATSSEQQDSVDQNDSFENHAGTYNGTLVVEYDAENLNVKAIREEPVRFVIDAEGNVTVSSNGFSESTRLRGDTFTTTRRVNVNYSDVTCAGDISANATIANGQIRGSGTGTGNCEDDSRSTPVNIKLELSANR